MVEPSDPPETIEKKERKQSEASRKASLVLAWGRAVGKREKAEAAFRKTMARLETTREVEKQAVHACSEVGITVTGAAPE